MRRAAILTEQPVDDHLGPGGGEYTLDYFCSPASMRPQDGRRRWYSACRGVVGGRCMHRHLYRDESRSGHFDLVGEGDHPWTIDLVTVTAAAILVVGFASALAAHLVR
jgi:hypothetical protein